MKIVKNIISFLILMFIPSFLIFTSCAEKLGDAPRLDIYTGSIGIKGSKDNTVHVESAKTVTFELDIAPNAGSHPEDYTVTYSSSDGEVFTVTEAGIVEGLLDGEATLSISARGVNTGDQIKASIPVLTTGQKRVTDIELDPSLQKEEIVMQKDESIDLNPLVKAIPEDAFRTRLSFESSNPGVATVDGGVLKSVSGGEAVITIQTTDRTNIKKELLVNVRAPIITWYDEQKPQWTIEMFEGKQLLPDNAGGGDKWEYLFDNDIKTFINTPKPGKSSSTTTPTGFYLDMKKGLKVNKIYVHHRNDNSFARLRLWAFNLSGSNDGVNYTEIQRDVTIPNADIDGDANKEAEITLESTLEFQYLKLEFSGFDNASGNNIQIAEMKFGWDESLD